MDSLSPHRRVALTVFVRMLKDTKRKEILRLNLHRLFGVIQGLKVS